MLERYVHYFQFTYFLSLTFIRLILKVLVLLVLYRTNLMLELITNLVVNLFCEYADSVLAE